MSILMVYKFHLFGIMHYLCLYLCFRNSISWEFCNIYGCNFGFKIPPVGNFALFLPVMIFIIFTYWEFCNISACNYGFIKFTSCELCNISGVMRQLMGWLKMKIIVSIAPKTMLSTFSGETAGENANNLWFPMLKPRRDFI